jgi:hypothetical protein
MNPHNPQKRLDNSGIILVITNVITIFLAVQGGWDLKVIMLIYAIQNLIIGGFHARKILNLEKFSTKGLRINRRRPEATKGTKIYIAIFFLIHFGIFNIVYVTTIIGASKGLLGPAGAGVFLASITFLINHYYSYKYNKKIDSKKIRNIGHMMFFPYFRIIPMHLTIALGIFLAKSTEAMVFFMVLKTAADWAMHKLEHKVM